MRKLLWVAVGAIAMELLAMEVKVMHLPSVYSLYFGVVAVVLVAIALLEKPKPDERDQLIVYRSSHVAFLCVAAVLIGILLYQTISRAVEPWTLVAIVSLVFGKLIGRYLTGRRLS